MPRRMQSPHAPLKENPMMLLLTWLINAVALLAVPYLLHSVQVDSFGAAMIAALILGLVNTLVRPVLVVLTLPVTLLSLGLFIFIINGLMFWVVAQLVGGFHVAGFWSAVGGALLYSIVSWALSTLLLRNR
jgi:putative membrane protein